MDGYVHNILQVHNAHSVAVHRSKQAQATRVPQQATDGFATTSRDVTQVAQVLPGPPVHGDLPKKRITLRVDAGEHIDVVRCSHRAHIQVQ